MFDQYQDILNVFDVAEALCIGKNRVYELLGNGSLKGFQIGRVWKIPRENLTEYIRSQSRDNNSAHSAPKK